MVSNKKSLAYVENNLTDLSDMDDPLEKLDKAINWNHFKPILNKAFRKERKSNAGRPPFSNFHGSGRIRECQEIIPSYHGSNI
jgi:hypothetical protein